MATHSLQHKTRALRERLNQSVAMRLQQRAESASLSDLPDRTPPGADAAVPPMRMPNKPALNPPNPEATVARGANACAPILSKPPIELQPGPAPTAPGPISDTTACAQNQLLTECDDVLEGTNAELQIEPNAPEPAKISALPVPEAEAQSVLAPIAQTPITKAPETTETPLERILRKQNQRPKQQDPLGQISANLSTQTTASNQRTSNRKTTQLAGHICNEGSSTMIDVVIKDLSGTGARVSLSPKGRDAFSPIPKIAEKFHLYITYDRMFVRCRLQWQNGDAIGVQYLAAPQFY